MVQTYDPIKYKTPIGTKLNCKGWIQEAALRMLLNNLDPEVAEKPGELIVYGGRGKAARNFEALDLIIKALKELNDDETLLIQSGKPVGIMKTHKDAPRVLISNSNLVPNWANWEVFDELEKKGLMMYGQMTAGSWIYIGSQGIVQGTYETYAAIADKHFASVASSKLPVTGNRQPATSNSLKGTLNVTAGLGGMGGAQPLAITMNEGVALIAEVEESRIDKRIQTKYLDEKCTDIDEAIDKAQEYKARGIPKSIGVRCNAVYLLERLVERNIIPDTLTDQTSAHDPISYWPHEISYEQAKVLREKDPEQYIEYSYRSMYRHVQLMLQLMDKGAITFDYGNNIRARAKEYEEKNLSENPESSKNPPLGGRGAVLFPGFVPAYIRPLFCEGKGPFRWAALSGDPNDIKVTDDTDQEIISSKQITHALARSCRRKNRFPGIACTHLLAGAGRTGKSGTCF